jgi:tryptophan synthase beta chain
MSNSVKDNEDNGFFGEYGGQYAPEALMPILEELRVSFRKYEHDADFQNEFLQIMEEWGGRPTPLYYAENLSKTYGAHIYLKREDLLHGGAHKTNNALGQGLLAKKMGKTRIIAETGAGQHGVATAMACAKLNLPCTIYMGAIDIARQAPNVQRMKILGAEVISVTSGGSTLKDAINEAMRDWISSCDTTHYMLGTAAGPHPFPSLVKHFLQIIGRESRQQCLDKIGRLPDYAIACVGGGSNAMGLFSGFMDDESVKFIGAEPGGEGIDTDKHGAVLVKGVPAVLHGMRSLALQDEDGQIFDTHSISAGLDYPLVGPEHPHLRDIGRAEYYAIDDWEAVEAFYELCDTEGIIPALESAHALAQAFKTAKQHPDSIILVNLSGRGDKDLHHVMAYTESQQQATKAGSSS